VEHGAHFLILYSPPFFSSQGTTPDLKAVGVALQKALCTGWCDRLARRVHAADDAADFSKVPRHPPKRPPTTQKTTGSWYHQLQALEQPRTPSLPSAAVHVLAAARGIKRCKNCES
jgi:hypothetical protein